MFVGVTLLVPACRDTSDKPTLPTTGAAMQTRATAPVRPGTIAVFDIPSRAAKKLDLGRALIQADWIDDGETLLAIDADESKYVAVRIDGTLVRELASITKTASEEPLPLVYAFPVHDGRTVAISDRQAGTLDLVDVFDGSTVRMKSDHIAAGEFSFDGELYAGVSRPLITNGEPDRSSVETGVWSRNGGCGDNDPYACVEWELPQEEGFGRSFAPGQTWSADGKRLLVQIQRLCPPSTPGSRGAPCVPEPTYEVYSWPEHQLLFSLHPGASGSARWAGSTKLFVDGMRDAALNASRYLVALDGTKTALPRDLQGCCGSFSFDAALAVDSAIPGEDCSLSEVSSGTTLASVPKGPGDTNDTGICGYVRWTPDGSKAIATGVNTP